MLLHLNSVIFSLFLLRFIGCTELIFISKIYLIGLIPHSQRLSEPNQPNSYLFKILSIIVLPSTPRLSYGLFPIDLPVKIFKAFLSSSRLCT